MVTVLQAARACCPGTAATSWTAASNRRHLHSPSLSPLHLQEKH
jgi:hypothetical protein